LAVKGSQSAVTGSHSAVKGSKTAVNGCNSKCAIQLSINIWSLSDVKSAFDLCQL